LHPGWLEGISDVALMTEGERGNAPHKLQRLGGWRTSAMVERYAHLAPDHLHTAASRLVSVLPRYISAMEQPKEKRPESLQAA
jgi:hypothetical protein